LRRWTSFLKPQSQFFFLPSLAAKVFVRGLTKLKSHVSNQIQQPKGAAGESSTASVRWKNFSALEPSPEKWLPHKKIPRAAAKQNARKTKLTMKDNTTTTVKAPAGLIKRTARATEIKKLHDELMAIARTSIEKAIRIGKLLTEQKSELPHGQFLPWLMALCEIASDERSNNFTVSMDKIASKCCLSRRTVLDRLNDLEFIGLVEIFRSKTSENFRIPSAYLLLRCESIAQRRETTSQRCENEEGT
jgi:hypothetical protein